jgi:type I restriction enzyme S subunit
MLPEGWQRATLESCVDILDSRRIPLNSEQRRERQGNIPYWGANGIVDYIDDYLFDEPLVLIAEDGGYFDEAATRPICHKLDGKAWVNNHAHIMRTLSNATRDWVYYYYVHRDITPFINGGTRAKLNQSDLRGLEIVLPPLPEQRRIAEILGSVDGVIEATKVVIKQTKTVKQGLLQSLLTRGISHTEFKDSPIGQIPANWSERNLGDVIDFINGYAFKPEDWSASGTPIIRIQNLNGSNDFNYYEGTVPSKCHVHEGDLLFCWSGSRGTSFGARKWQGPLGFLNQHIFRCVVSNELDQAFAFYLLEGMTRHIESEAHGGGGLVHIKKSELVKFEIGLPPIEEQKQIVGILAAVDQEITLESSKLATLINLKSGLMDDLLTGKVRVPEAMGLAA